MKPSLVGIARVDFHGGLRPFEEFEIGTEVVSWNDRWFYMRQTFRTVGDNPRTVATGYVKTLCRARTGVIPPKEIVRRTLGIDLEAPERSDDLRVRFGVPSADHVPVVIKTR